MAYRIEYTPAASKFLRQRLRVGDYRVVYRIQDDVLIVLVVEIGHRREIYRKT